MTPEYRRSPMKIRVAHLYPQAMDLYGDGGNVVALQRRCEWRGIRTEVVDVHVGRQVDLSDVDIIVMGGGQDTAQAFVAEDLRQRGALLRDLVDGGAAALAVCGAFQLFGTSYTTAEGQTLDGIGVFDAHTVSGADRFIGNVTVEVRLQRFGAAHAQAPLGVVGFENHSGLTYLGSEAAPFGRVLNGAGNLGDGTSEGAVYKNAIGTYLHGPLLPKNPRLADHLIHAALSHRYGTVGPLVALDDVLELDAHRVALTRCETGRVAQARPRLAS